jgi:glycosyltransferase involved in cell wall biosynthesis
VQDENIKQKKLVCRDEDSITIVVPVFNVEKYLVRCLDSIVNQSVDCYRVILVDDGSVDKSGHICDEYAKHYPYISVYHKSNGGLSSARNYGIERTTTRYLTLVDSDDAVSRYYIENLRAPLLLGDYDLVLGGADVIRDSSVPARTVKKVSSHPVSKIEAAKKLLYSRMLPSAWGKLYKTAFFKQIRYPEGKLFEDTATTVELILAAGKICILDTEDYYYFMNPNSISHKALSSRSFDRFSLAVEAFNVSIQTDPKLYNAALRYLVYHSLSLLRMSSPVDFANYQGLSDADNTIRRYGLRVLVNPKSPVRDKIGICLYLSNYSLFLFAWKVYEKVTNRVM